jgi:hypothetical protein
MIEYESRHCMNRDSSYREHERANCEIREWIYIVRIGGHFVFTC